MIFLTAHGEGSGCRTIHISSISFNTEESTRSDMKGNVPVAIL